MKTPQLIITAVDSVRAREQALHIAGYTDGVTRVEDGASASAQPPTPPHSDDEALAALVQSRWSAEPDLKALSIQATAKDGVLLLDGAASTAAAKQRALSVARGTAGVIQVIDRVRVGRTR